MAQAAGGDVTNPLNFISMIRAQSGRQELARIPEASSEVTENLDDVLQYDQVMKTALAVAYALGLTVVHRARPQTAGRPAKALDLASGPGLYTLCLQTHLKYTNITGIDLSPNMINIAEKNAHEKNMEAQVSFQLGDISNLTQFDSDLFDL